MKRFYLLFISVLIMSLTHAEAAWEQLKGPVGGYIYGLASDSSGNMYCAATNNFFKSTDYGFNWIKVNDSIYAGSFAINAKGDIYGINQNGGAFLSTNQGKDWKLLKDSICRIEWPYYPILAIDKDNNLFFSSVYGIYRSTDGGFTWSKANNGLSDTNIITLNINKKGELFASIANGLFLSTNFGNNWLQIYSDTNSYINSIDFNSKGDIFTSSNKNVSCSTDNGSTWKILKDVDYGYSIVITSKDHIIVNGWGNTIQRSTDNGQTWDKKSFDMTKWDGMDYPYIIKSPNDNIFYVSERSGLYSSTNEGSTWEHNCRGLYAIEFNSIVISNNRIITSTPGPGIQISDDGGQNWQTSNKGLFNHKTLCIMKTLNGTLLVGTDSSHIFRSTDNGDNWTSNTLGGQYFNQILIDSTGNLYTSYDNNYFKSNDDGITWDSTSNITGSLIIKPNGTRYWLNKQIYKSTDNGINWLPYDTLPDSLISSIAINTNDDIFLVTTNGTIMYKTNNKEWASINNGLKSNQKITKVISYDNIVIAYSNSEIFYTKDFGNNWVADTVLGNFPISCFTIDGNDIYLGTRVGGIFKKNFSYLSIDEKPSKNNLLAIYPNPATDLINVEFNDNLIPTSIVITNLLGFEMKSINFNNITGNEIEFDTRDLTEGIYFCRLQEGNQIEVRKFVVSR